LKSAIAGSHARIESLPLTTAMIGGQLGREAYLGLLAELESVHEPLEAELARHAGRVPIYRPDMARTEVLRRDRLALGGAGQLGAPASDPLAETRELIDRIREWANSDAVLLLGVLYVFEGSRMGSLVLAKRLATSLGVPSEPGVGLDYHLDGAADRPRAWGRMKGALDALPLAPEQQDAVVAAATETMDRLCAIYAALPAAEPVPA
ncbi:MAG: biliverdin-producing heme oxygenase, partial [Gemmataceae bacterium]|nr:biliverdin-producing heme oxygenase [Gemmataceae bacterium]